MTFDPYYYPYPSRRTSVYARRGMVATQQPLAAQAGLRVLQQGGNAIDAAIACAAVLTVVEPTANGIGGDAFAVVWNNGRLHGLNASGTAPQLLSLESLRRDGYNAIPRFGVVPVTVPGVPAAWSELSQRFGRLSLSDTVAPAIEYAANGYPVSPTVARLWSAAVSRYRTEGDQDAFEPWFATFAPDGLAPSPGEILRLPDHARTLEAIATTQADAFYHGDLADRMDHFFRQHGGYLRKEDLQQFRPMWVDPLSIDYKGYRVWEMPPNGHGLVTLLALSILNGFDLGTERETVEAYHLQIEALKLAFADGQRVIADPDHMRVNLSELLSEEYAAERRKLISRQAIVPQPGTLPKGGTVFLCTADDEGNMVSYIQSNYMGFGSGIVIPNTGIAMQNRGHNFSIDPEHPNALGPGKRPYHTIIPGFLTKDGRPVGPFGVMGGFMQPQGHVQVVTNTVDFGLNPQAALDAPRWQWTQGLEVALETGTGEHLQQALARRGHMVVHRLLRDSFGLGQIIWRSENGVLIGASDPRTDAHVAAW